MRVFITLILSFFIKSQYAQTLYSDYLDNSCEWYYYQVGVDGSSTTTSYITYYIDGDTITNNNYYFKRYYDRLDTIRNPMFGSTTVNQTTRVLFDLIREDSLKRFYTLYTPNTDIILYDFNLSVNDTFANASCTVFDIDSVSINNRTLYWFLAESVPNDKKGLIEGVGHNKFICGTPFHQYESLVCFKKQNQTLTVDTTKNCNAFLTPNKLTTSLSEFNTRHKKIKSYPNPVSDYLNIVHELGNDKIENIQIFNSVGQFMQTPIAKSENIIQIDASEYNRGLYFVIVSFNNGHFETISVIVSR